MMTKFFRRSVPFDEDLVMILERCMLEGHWLVLQECQLKQIWRYDLIHMLTTLIQELSKRETLIKNDVKKSTFYNGKMEESESNGDLCNSLVLEEIPPPNVVLHDNFRLWLILSVENKQIQLQDCLPDILIRRSFVLNLTSQIPLREVAVRNMEILKKARVEHVDCEPQNKKGIFDLRMVCAHAICMRLLASSDRSAHSDIDLIDFWNMCQASGRTMIDDGIVKYCEEFLKGNK